MNIYIAGAALFAITAIRPMELSAQALPKVELEISGGVTQLDRDASALHRNGTHGQLALVFDATSRISDELRVELAYHSIPGKPFPSSTIPNAGLVVASVEVLKQIFRVSSISMYGLAGVGSYRLDQGSGRESHLG